MIQQVSVKWKGKSLEIPGHGYKVTDARLRVTRHSRYSLPHCHIYTLPYIYSIGTQILQEIFDGHVKSIQQIGIERNIGLPPPARNRPDALFQARIYTCNEAVTIEDGQYIISPLAHFLRFVDFPDVIKIKNLTDGLAVPQQAIKWS